MAKEDDNKRTVRSLDLRKGTNRKLIGWVFVACGVISGVLWLAARTRVVIKMPQVTTKISYEVVSPTPAKLGLVEEIENLTATASGSYAVAVHDLDSGERLGMNENIEMPAASIMKVPIMVAVHKAAGQGKLNLDQTYALQNADKREGSGPIVLYGAGTKLTVRQLLTEMGKKSDNTAPVILIKMVGRDYIKQVITELGMTSTDFDKNTTTAKDVATMWARLYDGAVVGIEHRDMIFGYLVDSIYEDRIPAGLPKEAKVRVIHKVGTDEGVWADAGIVMPQTLNTKFEKPNNQFEPFIIVILNQGVKLEEAKRVVPEIVRIIWNGL